LGVTAQDNNLVAVRDKGASEQRTDLTGAAWDDDLHFQAPAWFLTESPT
jgi:hypothetical protein